MYRMWLLGALAAFAVILAIPNVAAVLLMATFGLAAPALLAGAAAVYIAAAVTGARVSGRRSRAGRLSGALAAVLIVALAPGLLARWQAHELEGRLRAADVGGPLSFPPLSIEVREPFASLTPAAPFETEPCGPQCRGALLSGEVEWIRIVRQARQDDFTAAIRFRAVSGSACAAPEIGRDGAARCVVVAQDNGEPAALTINAEFLEAGALAAYRSAAPFAPVIRHGRRLTATTDGATVWSRTEASVELVSLPFLIWPAARGMSSGGYEVWRSRETLASLSLADGFAALVSARATKLTKHLPTSRIEMLDPPSPEMINRATSTLELAPHIALNRMHVDFVNDWINHARWWKPLPESAVSLARRILLDPRITRFGRFDQLLARPEVAPVLLPDMLDVVETRPLTDQLDAPRQALAAMRAVPGSVLEAERARIERIAAGNGAIAEAMREVAGRLP